MFIAGNPVRVVNSRQTARMEKSSSTCRRSKAQETSSRLLYMDVQGWDFNRENDDGHQVNGRDVQFERLTKRSVVLLVANHVETQRFR